MSEQINEFVIGTASSEEANEWMTNYKNGDPIPENMQRYCTHLLQLQCDSMSELARKFRAGEK